jgi:hypothetical protein
MKISSAYSHLIDEKKTLLPQLRHIKRSCLKPYVSDLQCMKYLCEPCSAQGKYSKCHFYEATHLPCFAEKLAEVVADPNIKPPKYFHPKTERLCYNRINLENILKPTWRLYRHKQMEPKWVNTPEHKEWRQKGRGLLQDIPCESTCKMAKWCAFYQNNIHQMLTLTDIISYDEDQVYFDHTSARIYERGYITKSYLYKHFIGPTIKTKELAPIRTEKEFKKMDDWQYAVYEKIYKKINKKPKNRKSVVKYILDILLAQEGAGELLMSYLWGLSVSFDRDKLDTIARSHNINISEHIKKLEELGIIGTFQQTTDFNKLRRLAQKYPDLITPTAQQVLEIDIAFLEEYVRLRKLEWFDPFYEWFIYQEKSISRRTIQEKFHIPQLLQIEMERRLVIRKDYRGITGKVQYSNDFWTNRYIMGAVFRVLCLEERKQELGKIINKNKEKVKRKNKEKLSTKQLTKLDNLHQQIIHNNNNNQKEKSIPTTSQKNEDMSPLTQSYTVS